MLFNEIILYLGVWEEQADSAVSDQVSKIRLLNNGF